MTRKMHIIAAASSAALATVAMGGYAVAEDECVEVECMVEAAVLRSLDAAGADSEDLARLFTDMRPLSDPEQMAELFEEIKVTYDGVDPEQMAELFEEIKVTYDEDLARLFTDMRPLSDPEQMAELFEEIMDHEEE